MKHTKANIIKLLEEMYKVKFEAAKEIKVKNREMFNRYMTEVMTLDKVIAIITRKYFFDAMVNTYFDEEDK